MSRATARSRALPGSKLSSAYTCPSHAEDGDLPAVDERADAGAGDDVVERADVLPASPSFDAAPLIDLGSLRVARSARRSPGGSGRAPRRTPRCRRSRPLFTKWRKRLSVCRILDGHLPLALVGVDHARHVGFELGADAERVLADHLAQVVEAAFEVLEPGRRCAAGGRPCGCRTSGSGRCT